MADFLAGAMPSSANWASVAFGGGTFVALGYGSNKAATSPDGITWTARVMPAAANWQAVVYGGGKFVAVSYFSTLSATSPDGITWTQRTLPSQTGWVSLAYGNNTFFALSGSNGTTAATSPDGITWTARVMPVASIWKAVAYGNGVFVALAVNSSVAATSPDGITWTQQALPVSTSWQSVTYGNGKFLAVSSAGGYAATSTDGVTWVLQALPSAAYWVTVTAAQGLFMAIAQNTSTAASSPDGVLWTQLSLTMSRDWGGVAYGGGRFAVVASGTAVTNNYAYSEASLALAVRIAALSPLSAAAILGRVVLHGWAAAPSPLGACSAVVYHDFTGQIGDLVTHYVMDLITPSGAIRVPISSWQATLQTGNSNYVQCVIPACGAWVDEIAAATEFVILRRAALPNGLAIEVEMARAPTDQAQLDRGAQRHTCTLSGYIDAFADALDPPAVFDRPLTGVRSISSGQSGLRVRCAIDWLLRPGHRAFVDGVPFVAAYINYYGPSGFDAYMDAGSRA